MPIENIIKCRVRFISNDTNERLAQGYENNKFYWIFVKQKNETIIIKREDEPTNSRIIFPCLDDFLNEFDICAKVNPIKVNV